MGILSLRYPLSRNGEDKADQISKKAELLG